MNGGPGVRRGQRERGFAGQYRNPLFFQQRTESAASQGEDRQCDGDNQQFDLWHKRLFPCVRQIQQSLSHGILHRCPADEVQMQVLDLLMTVRTGVHDQTVAVVSNAQL